jgi:ribose 1,5-bisphosphokinase PhnN
VALVWVTGTSGSGKSSICEVLKGRGHLAVDADWEGYSHWVHRVTGEVVVDSPYPVPGGWLDQFAWRVDVERVRSLAATASSGITFLCGSAENEADVLQYFDHVVCLVIDDETLRHRLATRTTNDFGKHPEELAAALKVNELAEDQYRKLGATVLDATRPLDVVVQEVLAFAGLHARD